MANLPNMDPKKNPMPTQEPQVRAHNFSEVALGVSALRRPSVRASASGASRVSR